ncbi:hypothetical protein SH467x_002284 [Pirellulaceae bacterium SH467]
MNERASPNESTPLAEPSSSNPRIMRHWGLVTIPSILLVLTGYLFLARPNVEAYLQRTWPWNHRPDALPVETNDAVPGRVFAYSLSFPFSDKSSVALEIRRVSSPNNSKDSIQSVDGNVHISRDNADMIISTGRVHLLLWLNASTSGLMLANSIATAFAL